MSGSPTATLFAPPPDLVAARSHSGAIIPSVPRKMKVVVTDTSAILLERSSSLSLIENVDMEKLIEDLMKMKVPPPAYRRIQDFLTKVCMPFSGFIHSSLAFYIGCFFNDVFCIFASQVGAGRTCPNN
jgi:hypothetical protein